MNGLFYFILFDEEGIGRIQSVRTPLMACILKAGLEARVDMKVKRKHLLVQVYKKVGITKSMVNLCIHTVLKAIGFLI